MSQVEYIGTELRMDGYYYSVSRFPIILYRNGVAIDARMSLSRTSFNELESRIVNKEFDKQIEDDIYSWELFQISNNSISTESLSSLSAISCKYLVNEYGQIINDSTFILTSVYNQRDDKKNESTNDTFHFKRFAFKPDSTNKFIN